MTLVQPSAYPPPHRHHCLALPYLASLCPTSPRLALPRLALPYLTSPPAVLNACVVITTNALLLFAVSTGTDILRRSTSLPRVFRLLWLSSCASFSLLCSGSCKDQQNLVCSCSVVWPSPHLLRISQVLVGAANNSDRADLSRADTLD